MRKMIQNRLYGDNTWKGSVKERLQVFNPLTRLFVKRIIESENSFLLKRLVENLRVSE